MERQKDRKNEGLKDGKTDALLKYRKTDLKTKRRIGRTERWKDRKMERQKHGKLEGQEYG
jgi:hypothetical protein